MISVEYAAIMVLFAWSNTQMNISMSESAGNELTVARGMGLVSGSCATSSLVNIRLIDNY